jgi:Flp pilus assembly protein CpaB
MKKNVVPLVIIALVVAVAATGIFYGLIVSRMDARTAATATTRPVAKATFEAGHVVQGGDFQFVEVKSDEPGPMKPEELLGRVLTERIESGAVYTDRLLAKQRRRSLDNGIPTGMRAFTMHVSDSSSVVDMIEAGDRIDVQSVGSKSGFNGPTDFTAKTILQNVVVYGLGGVIQGPGSSAKAILTVLVTPQDAERLALADAASRLRVALRNRQDTATANVTSVVPQAVVTSNFRPKSPVSEPVAREFEVQLVEVAPGQMEAASANLEVAAAEWNKKLEEWKAAKQASLWASSKLDVARGGEVTWRGADPAACVRIRVEQVAAQPDGSLDLRVVPEAERRSDKRIRLSPTESALVRGLVPAEQYAAWRERFAPGRPSGSAAGELVLIVSPSARR